MVIPRCKRVKLPKSGQRITIDCDIQRPQVDNGLAVLENGRLLAISGISTSERPVELLCSSTLRHVPWNLRKLEPLKHGEHYQFASTACGKVLVAFHKSKGFLSWITSTGQSISVPSEHPSYLTEEIEIDNWMTAIGKKYILLNHVFYESRKNFVRVLECSTSCVTEITNEIASEIDTESSHGNLIPFPIFQGVFAADLPHKDGGSLFVAPSVSTSYANVLQLCTSGNDGPKLTSVGRVERCNSYVFGEGALVAWKLNHLFLYDVTGNVVNRGSFRIDSGKTIRFVKVFPEKIVAFVCDDRNLKLYFLDVRAGEFLGTFEADYQLSIFNFEVLPDSRFLFSGSRLAGDETMTRIHAIVDIDLSRRHDRISNAVRQYAANAYNSGDA